MRGPHSISGKLIIGDGAWNFGPFLGGKTPKKSAKFFLRLRDAYKKYILQKKWIKTAISALSSGQSNLHPPIWGCHRQLDDHHRNPNSNDRDHLVGQLTRSTSPSLSSWSLSFLNHNFHDNDLFNHMFHSPVNFCYVNVMSLQ